MTTFIPRNPTCFTVEGAQVRRLPDLPFDHESAFLIFDDWLDRPCRVYAERLVPLSDPEIPGIVHCVGGGQQVTLGDQLFWARQGYASASFDWQIARMPHRSPDRTSQWPEGVVGQFQRQDSLEQSVLPLALQAARVTLSWLGSHSLVDASRLGMSGISWGGYLTWLTAAYEDRLKAIVPVYGASIFDRNGGKRHWPFSDEVHAYWLKNWDPLSLVSRLTTPAAYLSGTNDFFGNLDTADLLFSRLKAPKRWCLLPNADHAIGPRESALAKAWMRHYLLGADAVPDGPQLTSELEVPWNGAAPMESEIWWANTDAPDLRTCWHEGIHAGKNPTVAFARVRRDNGLCLCSPLVKTDRLESDSSDFPAIWPDLKAGTGWRWHLGSTQLYGNAVRIEPIDKGQRIFVFPVPGPLEAPVLLLLHQIHSPHWKLDEREILQFQWKQEDRPESIQALFTHKNGDGQETVTCPFGKGLYTIRPPDALTWSNVDSLMLQCTNWRQPFTFGPLRKVKNA